MKSRVVGERGGKREMATKMKSCDCTSSSPATQLTDLCSIPSLHTVHTSHTTHQQGEAASLCFLFSRPFFFSSRANCPVSVSVSVNQLKILNKLLPPDPISYNTPYNSVFPSSGLNAKSGEPKFEGNANHGKESRTSRLLRGQAFF